MDLKKEILLARGKNCPIKENYKQLKAKEQECEELKKQINKQKNAKIQLSKLSDKQLKEFCNMKQALKSIKHILETYSDDDWKATREIEKIIEE